MNIYYSQFEEDRWIRDNLNPPANGLFCEVGAYDGVASSNTYAFEALGWHGLLIEPDPEKAAECRRNRPGSITLEAAAGCAAHIADYEDLWINEKDRGATGFGRPGTRKIRVPVVRLNFAIGSLLGARPWLLSIDTEGTEADVWRSLAPVDHQRPECVIMEYRTFDEEPKDSYLISLMRESGYRVAHKTQCNLIFTIL